MFKKFFGEVKSLDLRAKLLLGLLFVLPFERIPSYDIGGLTIKLSLLIGFSFILVNLKRTLAEFKGMNHFVRIPRVFFELSLLSVLWVENLDYWFKANLVLGFCVALFYYVFVFIKNLEKREQFIELALKTILISAGAVIGFGSFQWFGNLLGLSDSLTGIRPEYTADKLGLPRMHSVLLEPLYFGLYLLLPLGILWADRAGTLVKNLYIRFGLIALIYVSILLSLARGAIVASVLVGILGLAYSFRELKKQLKFKDLARISLAGLAGVLVLLASTSVLGVKGKDEDHNYGKGFSTIVGHLETIKPWGDKEDAEDSNSINSRDVARSEAWEVITESKDNFVFGVGAGNYGLSLNPPKGMEATSNFVLLDVWAEYGLIGILMLVVFIGYLLILVLGSSKLNSRLSLNPIENILVVGVSLYLIGFLVQSITFGELTITHLWVALGILAAILLAKDRA